MVVFSPSALLQWAQQVQQEPPHSHIFRILPSSPTSDSTATPSPQSNDQPNDKENQLPPSVQFTLSVNAICQTCHAQLSLHIDQPNHVCTADGYPTHHFHTKTQSEFSCCGCGFTVHLVARDPILPIHLLQSLADNRSIARTYADSIAKPDEPKPTLVSTISTLISYVNDLLKDVRRNINTKNPHFMARIGLDAVSQAIFETIGFRLQGEQFIIPDDKTLLSDHHRLSLIRNELLICLYELQQHVGSANVPFSAILSEIYPANDILGDMLGVTADIEQQVARDPSLDKDYHALGLTAGAVDGFIVWTYRRLCQEDPARARQYLQALADIAHGRSSEALLTEVAIERSRDQVTPNDATDAYSYFGVNNPEDADDKFLMEMFLEKYEKNPEARQTAVEKLRVLATCRGSVSLWNFLKEQQTSEASVVARVNLNKRSKSLPVGLNNIGNTCYLNSVLQYYFTLVPFRDTVIHMDNYIEDEIDEHWQSKKIGGIEVDKNEVQRAKKFVNLLRSLFLDMKNSTQKAISPAYDLAYMALLNEKEEPATAEPVSQADNDQSDSVEKSENSNSDAAASTNPPQDTEPAENGSTDAGSEETKGKEPMLQKIRHKWKVDADDGRYTECMGNIMYLVEAALKPLETQNGEQVRDMVRDLFYGKARQILSYQDSETSKLVRKVQEEEFSHVIVDAAEGKDLYDGLDEYFFAGQVENFRGGSEATREVTVSCFPPVLQILIQRVQFDRATSNIYKSNAFVQFDKEIYVDRYCEINFEQLAQRRAEVAAWRRELQTCEKIVEDFIKNQSYPLPVPDMLEATAKILEDLSPALQNELDNHHRAFEVLRSEIQRVKDTIASNKQRIVELKDKIRNQYDDLKTQAYRLHAVFIHQGQANYGHYWIYIYDRSHDHWWKYNDSQMVKVHESDIYRDTSGSTANPYLLVYVKAENADALVETIAQRDTESTPEAL
ncbi:uncharacterized protein BYT42DRAFT_496848 [Radiomyces spectabilis]|uniref:uncharacterized protein n=1 Tax=Radiomyces spectabilis TaxID=64574 RepID=UPI00221E77C4|nr:uncharacterized protein BYT42DRAFT_496848 [Radiomyces spectabilis]KAI8377998.1 hypothetical protein BYT42DRAFT_496848 [Radiomyces spectabilis]